MEVRRGNEDENKPASTVRIEFLARSFASLAKGSPATTFAGLAMSARLPRPSCPLELKPQQRMLLPAITAQVCSRPAARLATTSAAARGPVKVHRYGLKTTRVLWL
jgi:hypothetical protein